MRRRVGFLSIVLSSCGGASEPGDCIDISENMYLSSSRDVSDMPEGCFTVSQHGVTVYASDFQDLSALSGLREAFQLAIRENASLESTAGLESVKVLSELRIEENRVLADVAGLDDTEVLDRVALIDNPRLSHLGLERVKIIKGELAIAYETNLHDLSDLAVLEGLGGLKILNTTGLVELGSLPRLETVATDVTIVGNEDLETLGDQPFAVGGHLTISDNASLRSIGAFITSLGSVGGTVTIARNPLLQLDFDLDRLREITGGSVIITDNGFPDPI